MCIYICYCIYLPEPYCVGEYFIDVYPSQSDDECKNGEIVSAIVDKVCTYVSNM